MARGSSLLLRRYAIPSSLHETSRHNAEAADRSLTRYAKGAIRLLGVVTTEHLNPSRARLLVADAVEVPLPEHLSIPEEADDPQTPLKIYFTPWELAQFERLVAISAIEPRERLVRSLVFRNFVAKQCGADQNAVFHVDGMAEPRVVIL